MSPLNRCSSSLDSYPTSVTIPGIESSPPEDHQIMVVSCYSDFDKLAHGPRGTAARHPLYVFKFEPSDGSMTLLNIAGDAKDVVNPAFSRFHPRLNVMYTCTEDIEENGIIIAYEIGSEGSMIEIGRVDAGGTSTCYLTLDRDEKNLLAVNYWDSTIVTIPLSTETGNFTGGVLSKYDPKGGKALVATAKKNGGVNHSNNDESTIAARQADPHSHAIVLDPYVGCIAYVPCLGKDLVREFFYDVKRGTIQEELNFLPSGLATGHPDGPRYLAFHPKYNIMYVVNELSSSVAVFSINKALIREINEAARNGESLERYKGKSTFTLIQSVPTIPGAFPKKMNTCGRICLHKSGRFVLVSNRGHQSMAILKVKDHGKNRGLLSSVGFFHTRGETPRHFKFDDSGQYLIVANQDTDNISVFNFNQSSGEIRFTGHDYRVPSPNFVCCCPIHDNDINLDTHFNPQSTFYELSVAESESESNDTDMTANNREKLEKELEKAMHEVDRLKALLLSRSVM
jgi:6-phosphogluconolactonase (cycloisomerase 2 family)